MSYGPHEDLKQRIKDSGLVIGRDIAKALREPPGTVSCRLNGFLPLTAAHRKIIQTAIIESKNAKGNPDATR